MAKLKKKQTRKFEGVGRYVCVFCGATSDYPLNGHNCWQRAGATNWERAAKDSLRFGDSGDPNFEYT